MGSQKRSALSRYQAGGRAWWETAISDVAPGSIVLRGHRVEDLIGSMSYAGIVGLLVANRELSEAQARLLEAALVVGVDHGVRAPSIAAARMAATSRSGFTPGVAWEKSMSPKIGSWAGR